MKRLVNIALAISAALGLLLPSLASHAQSKLEVYIAGGLSDAQTKYLSGPFEAAWEKANPSAPKLDFITSTWGQFDDFVAAWFTTGSGPDVIYLGNEYAATYGKSLANIDSQLKAWPDLKNYLPSALEASSYDGHLVGLPILMSPRPLVFRTDLAKPGGKDFKAPATFSDMVAFVKANSVVSNNAVQQQGYMDIGNGLFDAQEFIANIWAAGGELYNKDGSSTFDSAATGEALKYMYDRRRAVLPNEKTATLPAFQGAALSSGKVISQIGPNWALPAHDDKVWANLEVDPYPAGANGKQLIQTFTDWLSIPAYTTQTDAAVKFLEFIGSQDNAVTFSSTSADSPQFGWTPVRTDAWDSLKKADPVWGKLIDLAQKYGRGFYDIRASAELRPLITQQAQLYLTDQQSLKDTQAALKKQYDAILAKDGFLGAATPAAS